MPLLVQGKLGLKSVVKQKNVTRGKENIQKSVTYYLNDSLSVSFVVDKIFVIPSMIR
jgi:hypothetical protein